MVDKSRLTVDLAGITLRNPIILSSGPLTETGLLIKEAAQSGVGAAFTRTMDIHAGTPIKWEEVGWKSVLNGGGVCTYPYSAWAKTEMRVAKEGGIPVFGSFENPKNSDADAKQMAKGLADAGADMIVIAGLGSYKTLSDSIKAAKAVVDIPVGVKFGIGDWSEFTIKDFHKVGIVAEEAGADVLIAMDTIATAAKINVQTGKPIPGALNDMGWSLSGAAIHPLTVFCITKLARSTHLPIIGIGGITSGEDAIELMMAGATAVGLCSIALIDGLGVIKKITLEIESFLQERNLQDVSELIGQALK